MSELSIEYLERSYQETRPGYIITPGDMVNYYAPPSSGYIYYIIVKSSSRFVGSDNLDRVQARVDNPPNFLIRCSQDNIYTMSPGYKLPLTETPVEPYFMHLLHREDGPAITEPSYAFGRYFLYGQMVTLNREIPNENKWKFIKGDVRNLGFIKNPTKEMQEYVIQTRPDLINQIDNLDPELKETYKHELGLAGIEI